MTDKEEDSGDYSLALINAMFFGLETRDRILLARKLLESTELIEKDWDIRKAMGYLKDYLDGSSC